MYNILKKAETMDVLPSTSILKFNPNTLRDLRKKFNLDKSTINESIDILHAWLQKQVHHVKKDYPRSHLERAIIFNKGSVEKTKTKLDNICKLRPMLPEYFGVITREQRLLYPDIIDGLLPQMTPDHQRVYITRNAGKKFESSFFHYFRYLLSLCQYLQTHDYNNGLIMVIDYMEVDILELVKALNIVVMQHSLTICTAEAMDVLPSTSILKFNPNTLRDVRKQFNLDKSTINESIDILQAWLQKQAHHVKKDYPRSHLERAIIFNKGSVEKTKTKLDNICKLRRMLPEYFGAITREQLLLYPDIIDGLLPQMTPDHQRVYIIRNAGKKFESSFFHYFRYLLSLCQYLQTHDYNNGLIMIIDYMDVDILELFKALNIVVMQHSLTICTDGYGMRIAGLHILSKNKGIDLIVKMFNQVLSNKIASSIMVHKTFDSLYEYIPMDILPVEYGGTKIPLLEIYENNTNEITSDAYQQYLIEMSKAITNEEYRQSDIANTDYCGVPGTFRTIAID